MVLQRYLIVLLLIAAPMLVEAAEPEMVRLKEAPEPDTVIFKTVQQAIMQYKNSLQWSDKCVIYASEAVGFIETDWHPVHKGEVQRKIQVYVWGNLYRIDVWHKYKRLFWHSKPKKDYISLLIEYQLQKRIEELLADRERFVPDKALHKE